MKQFHYALITAAFAALLLSACGSADTDTAGSSTGKIGLARRPLFPALHLHLRHQNV